MAVIFAVMTLGPILAGIVEFIGAVVVGFSMVGLVAVPIVLAVIAVVAVLVAAISKIKDHWWSITNAFKTGGIQEGFKAIGKTILDFLLMPLDLILFALHEMKILSEENYQGYEKYKRSLIDTPDVAGLGIMKYGLPYGNILSVTEDQRGGKRFNPQYGIPEGIKTPSVGQSAYVKVEFVSAPEGMKVIEKSGMVAPVGIGKLGPN